MKPATPPARTGDEASDEALMERFCAGDSQAFDALFARYAGPVRGFLRRLVKSEAAADDLTQVAFLSLVRARGRFQAGARFKPWMYAIAANAAKDHRRRGAHETLPGDDAMPTQVAEPALQKDAGLERQVREALGQLPEAQREAIVLHRFHGLSFAEIALQAGVTESAVKVRAHRGYERLRQLLGGLLGELQ